MSPHRGLTSRNILGKLASPRIDPDAQKVDTLLRLVVSYRKCDSRTILSDGYPLDRQMAPQDLSRKGGEKREEREERQRKEEEPTGFLLAPVGVKNSRKYDCCEFHNKKTL